ncbi:MAG: WD40 repeat domain-containing protein, partial [Anaerolineae bacterium]|nr:WD40 repeat domain-containing protein [Anaerolineae bacterium]
MTATQNERSAESQRLATLGNNVLNSIDGDAQTAILLGIRAMNSANTPEAEALLREALISAREAHVFADTPSKITCLKASPDGRYILRCTEGRTLTLFDSQTGEPVHELERPEFTITSAQFSPDSSKLALASEFGTIVQIFDVGSGQEIAHYQHADTITSLAFSPDSTRLASSDRNLHTQIYDLGSGQITSDVRVASYAIFTPDGQNLLDTEGGSIFDPVSGWTVDQLTGDGIGAHTLSASALGGTLLATYGGDEWSTAITVWDLEAKRRIRDIPVPAFEAIDDIALSPDGRYVIAGTFERSVRLWDVESGDLLTQFTNHRNSVEAVTFSTDGQYAYSGDGDGRIWKWHVGGDDNQAATFGLLSLTAEETLAVAVSSDGRYLATSTTYQGSGSTDYPVTIWDLESREAVNTLNGHTGLVTQIAFAPADQFIITSSSDGTIRQWQPETGDELKRLDMAGHFAITSDAESIVIADNEGFSVW